MNAVTEMISPSDVQAKADEATRAAVKFVEENRIAVIDLDSCARAVAIRTAIGERLKAIEAQLKDPKSWADKLHKWFCSLEKSARMPYERLDAFERDEIRAFNDAETRRRQTREREIAEQERAKQQAAALEEAAHLETMGEPAMAAAVVEEAIAAPTKSVTLVNECKSVGVKTVRRWRWHFVGGPQDVSKTPPEVRARAKAIMPRDHLIIDDRGITAYVTDFKDAASIPGVHVYYTDDPVR